MSRIRDIANILSGGSSAIATDAEIPSSVAGKNKIINGDFAINQRGITSYSQSSFDSLNWLTDRTYFYSASLSGTRTASRQTFTPGSAPVAGYEGQAYLRYNATVAETGNVQNGFFQKIEDVRTLAGQTATLSYWARSDSNRVITARIRQYFGTGGSTFVDSATSTATTSTSWTRHTHTISIPSISGKTIGTGSHIEVFLDFPVNVVQTIDIWGIQLEAGSVATPFTTHTGSIEGELAACQRYFIPVAASAQGFATSSTAAMLYYFFPVTMRITPAVSTPASLTNAIREVAVAFRTPTAIGVNVQAGSVQFLATGMTGLTQFNRVDLNVLYELNAEF